MPDFRRGAEAIAKAQEKTKGGSFKPFTPQIFWKEDQDSKLLLVLNDIESIPTVDMIGFIPVNGKKADGEKFTYYEQVIARTDPAIDEENDPLVDDWDAKPRSTNLAVAVELEATYEDVRGRKRPKGFEVKTVSFDRRIRDDDGELTDDTEEVTAPVIGFISQSPHNFFNVVTSYDANEAPINETAIKITRVGSDTSTTYTVAGYPDVDIDLTDLLEYIENVSYLGDDAEELLNLISEEEDFGAAAVIGDFLLDKRLEELVDEERYNELYEGVDSTLDKWSGKGKKSSKPAKKKDRPARRSQRKEEEEPTPDVEPDAEPEEKEEKPKRGRPKAKKEETTSQEDPAVVDKLQQLRDRAAKHKSA